LEVLKVQPYTPLATTAWLPLLQGLRVLAIDLSDAEELTLPAGLHLLTRMEYMLVSGRQVLFEAQLPPALTSLSLEDSVTWTMPPQVRQGQARSRVWVLVQGNSMIYLATQRLRAHVLLPCRFVRGPSCR
jgi:hypothetical protein